MSETNNQTTPTEQTKLSPEERKKQQELKKQKKLERRLEKEKREKERRERSAKKEVVELTWKDVEEGTKKFGIYPRIQSHAMNTIKFTSIKDLNKDLKDQEVTVRARVHTTRGKGKAAFLLLRDQVYSVQATLFATKDGTIPKEMVKFAQSLNKESIVDVTGIVTVAPEPIASATQQDVELSIQKLYLAIPSIPRLPLLVEDAMVADEEDVRKPELLKKEETKSDEKKPEKKGVGQDVRLDNRVIDMRAPAHLAIFRIQSMVGMLFREFLYKNGFVEIHTPKLIGTASEGGANVFEVKYFNTKAYLAQSPQLYKQMAVQGDLMRVFEIGPVFRAENSQTHRHLTEFVGLDLEMEIKSHYNEVLDLLNDLFVYIFDGIAERCKPELKAIQQQYPFEPLQYQKKNLILHWPDAIKMLREDGVTIGDLDDIDTPTEKRLGRLVKEKYGTDFYMLDRFPLKLRPFYTMPCPDDPNYSNSYDLFMRGEEIVSGAQRIHDPELLVQRAKELNVNTEPLQAYIDSFKYGAWPHGGAGVGLERVTMLYLGLSNVRKTSMFPRDPKRLTP